MKSLLTLLLALCLAVTVASFQPVRYGHSRAAGRTFHFHNNCSFPVWFGLVSGAVPNGRCSAGCPQGSYCNPQNGICYFSQAKPANGDFRLSPNGGSNSVVFPYYNNGLNVVWSGALAGRTGCESGTCQTADCGPNPDHESTTLPSLFVVVFVLLITAPRIGQKQSETDHVTHARTKAARMVSVSRPRRASSRC
jgi:hypothetical protein